MMSRQDNYLQHIKKKLNYGIIIEKNTVDINFPFTNGSLMLVEETKNEGTVCKRVDI